MKAADVFNRFLRTQDAPARVAVPDEVLAIYRDIQNNEEGQQRSCGGGFVYGGAFLSWHKRTRPRDIDLCITAPDLVQALENEFPPRAFLFSCGDFSFDFESMGPIADRAVIGKSVQLVGKHVPSGLIIDLLICTNPVDPALFFAHHGSAPIKSCAYDFQSGNYVYDRDFPADLQAWSFNPYDRIDPDMAEKIARDGMNVPAVA